MNTSQKKDPSEIWTPNSLLEERVAAELKLSPFFEVVERSADKNSFVEGLPHAIPDLVLRHDDQYLALEIVSQKSDELSGVAVRMAARAGRLRQQLPDEATLVLVICSAIEQIYGHTKSPEESVLDPDSVDPRLRSSAKAALRKPGFDAVIFINTNFDHALLVKPHGRKTSYERALLHQVAQRALEAKPHARAKLPFQEWPGDSNTREHSSHHSDAFAPPFPGRTKERYLLVADEIRPSKGGISSLNLELAKALRAHGREVCIALPYVPSEAEQQLASSLGIKLALPATQIPGIQGPPAFLSGIRYLGEKDFRPTVIVGHGRILGPYAYAIQRAYPSSARLHLVHMHAEELERAKELDGGEPRTRTAVERSALEIELAMSANIVAGVGKKLTDWISDQVINKPLFIERGSKVVCMTPGLRATPQRPGRIPAEKRFLITARAEDFESKGIATAIRAVGKAKLQRPNYPDTITLIIRGVPEDHLAVKKLVDDTARPYGYQPILRPYTTDPTEISNDLNTSVAVLMPSKTEGFGLSAYEAIAAGIPTLISRDSGLARLVRDVGGSQTWPPEALLPSDEDSWVDAILKTLDDPESSFRRAWELREAIEKEDFWQGSISQIELALLDFRNARGAIKSSAP